MTPKRRSTGEVQQGVLLMAHGTPANRDDIERFYSSILGGRTPAPEHLTELVRRYDMIGGLSPMARGTEQQRAGLQSALDAVEPGQWRVWLGTKHASPSIEEAAAGLALSGTRTGVAMVLAPQYSALSVGAYLERAATAFSSEDRAVKLVPVRSWHDSSGLAGLFARRLRRCTSTMHHRTGVEPEIVFSAHSLPRSIEAKGDPYPDQVRDTARRVATLAGIDRYHVAFQSAGKRGGDWLEPDLSSVIRDLADDRVAGIVVCPIGFVSDHLEVLYDIDIEARSLATSLNIKLSRTRSLNADPSFMAILAAVVIQAAEGAEGIPQNDLLGGTTASRST
ncbi:MAG: ferrochelatase [Actinomycetota bacterium]|nr:ferrochelatase [Actinomycetota bacterium]